MKLAAFKKKFDLHGMDFNDNILTDIACPKCGGRERFTIDAVSTYDVTNDGAEQNGDVEWYAKDRICCENDEGGCSHVGTVGEFTIDGLDAAIDAIQQR